jgi:hypothetical protein
MHGKNCARRIHGEAGTVREEFMVGTMQEESLVRAVREGNGGISQGGSVLLDRTHVGFKCQQQVEASRREIQMYS